jgi:hypothetical protein
MSKEELIEHYERHLEKVKTMWNVESAETCLMKERCQEYVNQAEKDLEKVRNGRGW